MKIRTAQRAIGIFALVAATFGVALSSSAQIIDPDAQRAAREIVLDSIDAAENTSDLSVELNATNVLPPIPIAPHATRPGEPANASSTLVLKEISFEGNTVVADDVLEQIARPWLDQPLSATDLEGLRDALTAALVRAGYLTSGAVFPPQAIEKQGRLVVKIVEGILAEVIITGADFVAPHYYASRISRGLDGPLHVPSLEARLRRLQRDPRLSAIHATIRPGERPGETILDVEIEERPVIAGAASLHNQLTPSLGEVRVGAALIHRSFAGIGDTLTVGGDWSEAGGGVEASYQVPLNAYDTSVSVRGRYRQIDVSDGVGRVLDIEGKYWSIEAGLYQPLHPTGRFSNWEFGVGLIGELAQSKISFTDEDRSFPIEGGDNGKTRLAMLRLVADAVYRRPRQVIAFRSMTSVGLDLLGATRSDDFSQPNGRYWAWLAQLQAVRRVTDWNIELIGRANMQLTNQQVFGLAQFAVGGSSSVRGYRQNRVVRDEGISGGVEARIPLWRDPLNHRPIVQLIPFVDAGRAWSRHGAGRFGRAETLASAGVGLRAQLGQGIRGEFYWARPLRRIPNEREPSALQDRGLHFRISASWP